MVMIAEQVPARPQSGLLTGLLRRTPRAVPPPASVDATTDRIRIVVAQGNVLPRRHFLIQLAGIDNSHVVGVVTDANRALEVIRKTHPDIVILDFLLGGGGALHVLDSIGPEDVANIIVTTPHAYAEYHSACEARGVRQILSTYPDHDELSAALNAIREAR